MASKSHSSPTKPQRKVLLIDADVLAYQAANGEQRVTDWGDGVVSVAMGSVEEGIGYVLDACEAYKRDLEADDYILCLSHPDGNFRKQILPSYKAQRGERPLLVDPIREVLTSEYGAVRRPLLEGDDVLGIYATHPKLIPGFKIIVSIDKDMRSIPGMLYNPMKQRLEEISVEGADYWHMLQTLTGDTTDNYKGCPGIGPVKAEALLRNAQRNERDLWEAVETCFVSRGCTKEDALIQAQVARICRNTDYDFKRKTPIKWHPPTTSA